METAEAAKDRDWSTAREGDRSETDDAIEKGHQRPRRILANIGYSDWYWQPLEGLHIVLGGEVRQRHVKPDAAFYRPHRTVAELLGIADELCSHTMPLSGATFAAETELASAIRSLSMGRRKPRGFVSTDTEPYLVGVPINQASNRVMAKGFFWQDRETHLVHLLSTKDDFDVIFRETRKYLFTDLTQVYVQTEDFRKGFQGLVLDRTVDELEVSDYTAWVMADDSRRAETRRVWLPERLNQDDFFGKLEGEDQRIRSLGVYVAQGKSAHGRVKRDLTFSCDAGFGLFFDSVIARLRTIAAVNRALFMRRGAADSPTHLPRPLQMTYDASVFDDKSENRRLIEVLKRLPDSGLSVFHPNPYIHASLIDYWDGSSYTIWVNENSTICIVPEKKASPGSFERLCNHIAEFFGEAMISEVAA